MDFTSVLPDIMIIADEVDSELKQAIGGFLAAQREGGAEMCIRDSVGTASRVVQASEAREPVLPLQLDKSGKLGIWLS